MPDPNVLVGVHQTLDIPVAKAEQLVGRPWTSDDPDDDSFLCDLEARVRDALPDLMEYVTGEPDVEVH